MGPVPDPSPLDRPTPAPSQEDPETTEEEQVSVTEIDLDDSAELTPENMQRLLDRAKRAGQTAAKKTKMAYDTTKALADSGLLRTTRFHKKHRGNSNGTGE